MQPGSEQYQTFIYIYQSENSKIYWK